jgi:hypothetical protein
LEYDLSKTVAVVVLKAVGGSAYHAIAVHDGFIFDSNEATAIALSKSNLCLLCSTETQPGMFDGIARGYLFSDSRCNRDGINELKVHAGIWHSASSEYL